MNKEAGGSGTLKREIESLIAGELVTKEIHQDLTYPDMYSSIDNIWSVLFTKHSGHVCKKGAEREFLPRYAARSSGVQGELGCLL